MQVYLAGANAPGQARCRSCQAPITWVTNVKTGKKVPIDGGPDCVKIVTGGHGEVDLKVTLSHFATCKDSASWRNKR